MWLSFSKFGAIVLGEENDKPDYSRASWYAMLFAAGMGIGLVFYGVAEPLAHFRFPPTGEPKGALAAENALALSFHHWGLHAWAIYAVLGLGIAYFYYRHKLPLSLRSCFYPLFGDRIYGWVGHTIDILAVFGTLFGLATSLGAGAGSVNAGLNRLVGLANSTQHQIIIIVVITICAICSLVIGLDKGIRRLSEINMALALLLLGVVLAFGPTVFILERFIEGIGVYTTNFIDRSFRIGSPGSKETGWIRGWSVVYWGWWIAWAPFVGIFVARISKGRTVRDFLLSVIFVPVGVTFFWFAVFGGTALSPEFQGTIIAAMEKAGSNADAVAVYAMLDNLPFSGFLSALAVVVVTIFFVSSSDSASFVVDILTSGGHPNPPTWQRVFWATAEGATAAVLIYTGGDEILSGLKAGVVCFGLPFCVILLLVCIALFRSITSESVKPSLEN